jgi:hypothetical protein
MAAANRATTRIAKAFFMARLLAVLPFESYQKSGRPNTALDSEYSDATVLPSENSPVPGASFVIEAVGPPTKHG